MAEDYIESIRDERNIYTFLSPAKLTKENIGLLTQQIASGQLATPHLVVQRSKRVEIKCFFVALEADWKTNPKQLNQGEATGGV